MFFSIFKKITVSLTLVMKKYHANLGVNRMKNDTATAAYVKDKCDSLTIIMYHLKTGCWQEAADGGSGGSEILLSPCEND